MSRNVKEVSAKSYISTEAYNSNFFTYTVSTGPSPQFKKTGALVVVTGATSGNCPAGNILRENGKKLFPDAYPGVTDYMVGVFDILNNLSGFIDPNDPVFASFNGDRPNYLKDSVNSQAKNLGAPTLTQGSVLCSGDVVSSGQVRSQDVTVITTSTGTIVLNPLLGQVFKLTATLTGAISLASTTGSAVANPGAVMYVIISNGGGQAVVGDLTTILTQASAVATASKSFSLMLVSDGVAFNEVSRTQF